MTIPKYQRLTCLSSRPYSTSPQQFPFLVPLLFPLGLDTTTAGGASQTNHRGQVSLPTFPEAHAPYEAHDQSRYNQQRGDQRASLFYRHWQPSFASSSSSSIPQSLRRTPKFEEEEQPSQPHDRSRSVDLTTPRQPTVRFADELEQRAQTTSHRRAASESYPFSDQPAHPAVRVSRRTAAAILFTLEDALRNPNPFTPDLAEENDSMSNLLEGAGGNGRASNGGSRGTSGPVPVSQTAAGSSGMRKPTDVMKQREAREARRKAEAEAAEADELRRMQDLERRRSAERRAAAAGVAPPRDSGYRSAAGTAGGRTPAEPSYQTPMATDPSSSFRATDMPTPQYPTGGPTARPRGPAQSQGQPRPVQSGATSTGQAPPTQSRTAPLPGSTARTTGQQPANTGATAGAGGYGDDGGQQSRSNTSSFPHAFERWEDLSSRWEGLTSYLLRRMEQHAGEIRNDPYAQQMSRQITDLSAAGANLFHAVVELQRLRASSERKFQRWFFEVREEQERAQATQARLQSQLEQERSSGRADVSGVVARVEQERKNNERVVAEMKRELTISKDEARRAWEELGRREQEERDRMFALKEGHAVTIGGVNVLPMQGIPSRGGSQQRPSTRDGPYQGQYTGTTQAEQDFGSYEQQEPSPTNTDPFTEGAQGRSIGGFSPYPPGSTAATSTSTARTAIPITAAQIQQPTTEALAGARSAAQQPPTTAATAPTQPFYSQPDTYLHAPTAPSHQTGGPLSVSDESEEELPPQIDSQGNVRLDASGRPIPFRPTGPTSTTPRLSTDTAGSIIEDDDAEREATRAATYGRSDSSGQVPQVTGSSSRRGYGQSDVLSPADYEGSGYGSGSGWEGGLLSRHQHLTRLSDVLEEEAEHSRSGEGGSPTR